MAVTWTDERIELLRKLYDDGLSCGQIAQRLRGVTRNAVIGKVHRLGFPLRGHEHNSVHSTRKRAIRKTRAANPPVNYRFAQRRSSALPAPTDPLPPPHETDIARVSVNDVTEHQCRWPGRDPAGLVGDTPFFCGAPKIPGLPYCEVHCRRAFQPPKPRQPMAAAPVPATTPVLEVA